MRSLLNTMKCSWPAAAALLLLLVAAGAPAALAQASSTSSFTTASSSSSSSSAYATSSATTAAPPGAGLISKIVPKKGDPCVTLVDSTSSSCANGNCCDVKQRFTLCYDHTTALARINGVAGSCCVLLIEKKTGAPTTFCATPMAIPGARRFPAGVAVSLNPECTNNAAAPSPSSPPSPPAIGTALSCSATFSKLPHGYSLPSGDYVLSTSQAPWSKDLPPCGNAAFSRFNQTMTVDKTARTATFSVKCQ